MAHRLIRNPYFPRLNGGTVLKECEVDLEEKRRMMSKVIDQRQK
ncbi:hypothetical protein SS1G_09287 [Sclerotinia sclerotiorum 1980 UF-70]|uniref:Uncharacterized protein n=1 Tax=Sclerotinia sclerotiorum (strain ATCC 18683 / 1980 / Ss-1) TaxID=665079 RepID=A7EVC9_SCLS1|nr:hypothetical protein SS1G_09287 [Sclerotinia sclerotiorum 1980 UF-70]EDN93421.1 hypothetical protein SS1G_09287 [Sclerotinia sclerotiorum 1980 UF-70]